MFGIAALTSVPGKNADAWQTFAGGLFADLEPKPEALENRVCAIRQAIPAPGRR